MKRCHPSTYPIAGTLVHMTALEAHRRRVEVKIHTPERRTKRVRQAWRPLIVQGVSFTVDHWRRRRVTALDLAILDNVSVNRARSAFMVHESIL